MVLYDTDIERLVLIHDYIDLNLEKDLRMDTIALKFSIQKHTLRRQFKIHLGIALHEYVLSKRMSTAYELLFKRTMPISEVAHAMGYQDLSTFSHAFSGYHGIAPNDCLKCGNEIDEI